MLADPAAPRAYEPFVTEHRYSVHELAFSPVGRTLVTADVNGFRVWDVSDPATPKILSGSHAVGNSASLVFSPDGRILAIGGAPTGRTWCCTT